MRSNERRPWNGFRAAVSLTFDDGLPCQLEHAIPEMDRLGVPGTFFLVSGKLTHANLSDWQAVAKNRHEIGSHSMTHRKAHSLNPEECKVEARLSKIYLQKNVTPVIASYAYPHYIDPIYAQDAVKKEYRQARGGPFPYETDNLMCPGYTVNFAAIPTFEVNMETLDRINDQWIDLAVKSQAWMVLTLHSIGSDMEQYASITPEAFDGLLEVLLRHRDKGNIWITPFKDAANTYRKLITDEQN